MKNDEIKSLHKLLVFRKSVLSCAQCKKLRSDIWQCRTGAPKQGIPKGYNCPFDVRGEKEEDLQSHCLDYEVR